MNKHSLTHCSTVHKVKRLQDLLTPWKKRGKADKEAPCQRAGQQQVSRTGGRAGNTAFSQVGLLQTQSILKKPTLKVHFPQMILYFCQLVIKGKS